MEIKSISTVNIVMVKEKSVLTLNISGLTKDTILVTQTLLRLVIRESSV